MSNANSVRIYHGDREHCRYFIVGTKAIHYCIDKSQARRVLMQLGYSLDDFDKKVEVVR